MILDTTLASRLAAIALCNVVREYPNKPDHVLGSPDDIRFPSALHPAFYGSYDWHSSVHMHWLLARLRRLFPELPCCTDIHAIFDRHLSADAVAGEIAYLAGPHTAGFERTYGWSWLLKLAEELGRCGDAAGRGWAAHLAPLAEAFVTRYLGYLPKARQPLRTGMHANSAFGLAFALDYARFAGHDVLARACTRAAERWYLDDRDYPAQWEPSGTDFLSPALMEADVMRRVLPPEAFARWLDDFLPGLAEEGPGSLFTPAEPSDRGDGQIVHLDGLNLARAWNARAIAAALPPHDSRHNLLLASAERHLDAGMRGIDNSDYLATHWLASFAVLALTGS